MAKNLTAVVIAVIIAVALVIVAGILSDTALDIKNKGYVTVKGFAKQELRSDLGIFRARIIVESPDLKACYEKLTADNKKVQDFLKNAHGVPEEDIQLERAWVREIYKINEKGHATNDLDRYVLEQSFRVESADVDKIAGIASGMVAILEQGVRVSIQQPEYLYTELDDLKIEMVGRATDNARQRAKVVAEKGNFRLGSIANVRTGVFQITPANSTTVSDYGMNDTSSIEKEIKSVVEIRYFVE
jgi:hypothetical protein